MELSAMTGFRLGQFPFRYLGVPIAGSALKFVHFGSYLKKISTYISLWNVKTLSYAGRLELIRGVLQGVHAFWMGILPIPSGVQKQLNKIARNFLWGNKEDHKKKAWVAWKDICLPKYEGGLGLFDLKAWNIALLLKHLWNIHMKKDSLWVRWMHHYYKFHDGIWIRQVNPAFLVLVKKLLHIRDILLKHFGNHITCEVELQNWMATKVNFVLRAYEVFLNKACRTPWYRIVWASTSTPKHCFIFLLATRDKLPTRDKLHYVINDISCPSCGSAVETQDHLLFNCPKSRQVWRMVLNWLCISNDFMSLKELIRWALNNTRRRCLRSKLIKSTFATIVYFSWNARNLKIFEDQVINVHDVVHRIIAHVYWAMPDRVDFW